MTKTRDQHLAWCKERAHEALASGDCDGAVASMLSDLRKHEAWRDDTMLGFLLLAVASDISNRNVTAVRRWIDGFN